MAKSWASTACFLLGLGIICGAFGAHALRDSIPSELLSAYEKGVFYHFVNALGLLGLALLQQQGMLSNKQTTRIGTLLLLGIVLFSGSLYALAITGVRWLGAITPLGGTAFILGWFLAAWELRRS